MTAMMDSPKVRGGIDAPQSIDTGGDGAAPVMGDTRKVNEPADPTVIAALVELQVRRRFILKEKLASENRARAYIRLLLGWRYDMDEKESAKLCKRAESIYTTAQKLEPGELPDDMDDDDARIIANAHEVLLGAKAAAATWSIPQKSIERDMKKLVKKLPVWPWVRDDCRGLGDLGLAQIVGECGDLANYANPGKVWKRLGLAPFNGRSYSTWRLKGGLSSEQWVDAGYCPRRRSITYLISESIVKSGGKYRELYDQRKVYELEREPEMAKHIAHKRAMRYAVKRMMKDLWCAWNGRVSVDTQARTA